MSSFKLSCPRCGAPEKDARLQVIEVKARLNGVRLDTDGFDLYSANGIDTSEEVVRCQACREVFPLDECLIWNSFHYMEKTSKYD